MSARSDGARARPKRDPAAEPDQGDAGSRIDELAEALSDSDAGSPDRQANH